MKAYKNNANCKDCLWANKCKENSDDNCTHFYPIGETAIDLYIDSMYTLYRLEFHETWNMYAIDYEECE